MSLGVAKFEDDVMVLHFLFVTSLFRLSLCYFVRAAHQSRTHLTNQLSLLGESHTIEKDKTVDRKNDESAKKNANWHLSERIERSDIFE